MDGWIDRQIDQYNKKMDGWKNKRMDDWIDG